MRHKYEIARTECLEWRCHLNVGLHRGQPVPEFPAYSKAEAKRALASGSPNVLPLTYGGSDVTAGHVRSMIIVSFSALCIYLCAPILINSQLLWKGIERGIWEGGGLAFVVGE